jgi:hypothetical protein
LWQNCAHSFGFCSTVRWTVEQDWPFEGERETQSEKKKKKKQKKKKKKKRRRKRKKKKTYQTSHLRSGITLQAATGLISSTS